MNTGRKALRLTCLGLAFATAGCGAGADEITAATSCGDYIQRPVDERHDAAVRISSTVGDVPSAGNPMWG